MQALHLKPFFIITSSRQTQSKLRFKPSREPRTSTVVVSSARSVRRIHFKGKFCLVAVGRW